MFITESDTGIRFRIVAADSQWVKSCQGQRVITDRSGGKWNADITESVAWRHDYSEGLTINWMNGEGFYSAPFNPDYCALDPQGYLDALRKGSDMDDLHVCDSEGVDVSHEYL